MSGFNGTGTFIVSGIGLPYVTATVISSTVANQWNQDVAAGLSNCITRDGQSPPTANLPMGGFTWTGMGAANAAGQPLIYDQINARLQNLGIGTVPGGVVMLDIVKNQNSSTFARILNGDPGTGAYADFRAQNGIDQVTLTCLGTGYGTGGLAGPGNGGLISSNNMFLSSGKNILFGTNGTGLAPGGTKMTFDLVGNLWQGSPLAGANAALIAHGIGNAMFAGRVSDGSAYMYNNVDLAGNRVTANPTAFYWQAGGDHIWQTGPNGAAGGAAGLIQRMIMKNNGFVGINTGVQANQEFLRVGGDIRADNSLYNGSYLRRMVINVSNMVNGGNYDILHIPNPPGQVGVTRVFIRAVYWLQNIQQNYSIQYREDEWLVNDSSGSDNTRFANLHSNQYSINSGVINLTTSYDTLRSSNNQYIRQNITVTGASSSGALISGYHEISVMGDQAQGAF